MLWTLHIIQAHQINTNISILSLCYIAISPITGDSIGWFGVHICNDINEIRVLHKHRKMMSILEIDEWNAPYFIVVFFLVLFVCLLVHEVCIVAVVSHSLFVGAHVSAEHTKFDWRDCWKWHWFIYENKRPCNWLGNWKISSILFSSRCCFFRCCCCCLKRLFVYLLVCSIAVICSMLINIISTNFVQKIIQCQELKWRELLCKYWLELHKHRGRMKLVEERWKGGVRRRYVKTEKERCSIWKNIDSINVRNEGK